MPVTAVSSNATAARPYIDPSFFLNPRATGSTTYTADPNPIHYVWVAAQGNQKTNRIGLK
jgi:hypothetical protein